MINYKYPAVFYYDKPSKTYCAAIDDLAIYMVGDTVEDAHLSASEVLLSYIKTSLKYGFDIPDATSFDELTKKHPNELVMLVECNIK